ncbi:zinc-binding alcohol dehydrogenase family protein [Flammeovirgaceae bacterium SG7u.111]|nr:zinc-binding alcohol dehydrogenase family protein [Flammeovirgaceae bacterium SG7u.132]WPO36074.1 zinc-binding alcohol dehydrogenase family protein [Flammeovirgaceae bacterium SG7u.111]
MKTIVLEKPGKLAYADRHFDLRLRPDEVLLKVRRIGICGSDYHAFAGSQPNMKYPIILGHELGVEVEEVGKNVANLKEGDRCAVEPYLNPVADQAVKNGFTNCGDHLSVFGLHEDGGLREKIKLPAKYLHKSDKLNFDELALVESLGIGCHAANRAQVKSSDLVLVVGAGPIGLASAVFAKAKGAKTVVLEINKARLSFCKHKMAFDGTIEGGGSDELSKIKNSFGGNLPTVILDATGNKTSMQHVIKYASPGARIVYVGFFLGDFSFSDPYFHTKELSLIASRNATTSDFRQVIKMMEEGEIDTRPWITHRAPFDKMATYFNDWLKPKSGVIKAMVSL